MAPLAAPHWVLIRTRPSVQSTKACKQGTLLEVSGLFNRYAKLAHVQSTQRNERGILLEFSGQFPRSVVASVLLKVSGQFQRNVGTVQLGSSRRSCY